MEDLEKAIKEIKKEIEESKKRNSTNNRWDYPYFHGLEKALEILEKHNVIK